ncbi:acyltransferase [Sphingomonas sp. BGYR3]|uniref:acyltransferase family protein n=1 Tax=Sphingomonas sp. BGYR3 TaxID=2975483 RepID=UPI0021A392A3|nr:acyltransferase [Sphingomonas sp. BGYR3]MDG5488544.1 acyltransferase [Sphingomonas sp. BGYR3]
MSLKYRREIDGLRAIAVLPVVLNHAKIPPFSGGFIGVDIFFVISGFLISKIIYDQATSGGFSIVDFYERRARRIVPALLVVVLASFLAAYLTMLPDDFENFSQSVVAAMFFSNNILLTLTSGYWELSSEFKPLLHTWSLAVEEQFYLFYPIAVIFIFNAAKRYFVGFLVIIATFSFGLSAALTDHYPNASFYLIHTRAWELLFGAIAAVYSDRINLSQATRNVLSMAGFAAILIAMFSYTDATPFPSFYAALPCVGTALVLLFATNGTMVNSILSMRPFVGVGIISYSVYLWHQPVFSFARILSINPPSTILMASLVVGTLFVSYFSWKYVEQPFRNRTRISRNFVFGTTIVGSGVVAALGLVVFKLSGMPARVPGMGLEEGSYIAYNERAFVYRKNAFVENGKPRLLVIGNSTARDFINVMIESGRFSGYDILYRDDASVCDDNIRDSVLQELVRQSDAVIAVANFQYDGECRSIDWRNAIFSSKPLVVVGPKHFGYNLNAYIHVDSWQRPRVRASTIPATLLVESKYKAMVPSDQYVDLLVTMDRRFGGVPIFDENGRILSVDRVHLTQAGAKFFASFTFDDAAWTPIFALGRAEGPRH